MYLTVILICIFSEVEHLSMCLFAILMTVMNICVSSVHVMFLYLLSLS